MAVEDDASSPGRTPTLPGPVEETTVVETDPPGSSLHPGAAIVPPGTLSRRVQYTESFKAHVSTVPMPAPGPLERLQALYPDAAEVTFNQWVSQAEHRKAIESSVIATNNRLAKRGQIIAAVIGLTGLIGSFIMVGLGHDLAGAGLGGTTVIALVSSFLVVRYDQKSERLRKMEIRARIAKGDSPESVSAGMGTKAAASRQAPKKKDKRGGK